MKLKPLAFALLAAPFALNAQAGQFTFTPMAGYQVFDNKLDHLTPPGIDDNLVYGGSVGYRFTPALQAELNYLRTDTDRTHTTGHAHDNLYSANGLYNFNTDGKFQPYVLLGVGQRRLKADTLSGATDTVVNGGLGAFYKLTDNFRLRGELRAVQDTDEKYLDGVAIVGLEMAYGSFGSKPVAYTPAPQPEPTPEPVRAKPAPVVEPAPVVAAPLDSDHDGVPDSRDKCPGTPAGAVVDENGCPVVLKEAINHELKILFDTNKAVIKPEYKHEVADVAKLAKDYPNADIEIQGHTDASGSKALNNKLSEERAHAVRDMLVQEYGIDAKRITYKGYGSSQPVADNKTAEGKAKNRRVIAILAGERKRIEMKKPVHHHKK